MYSTADLLRRENYRCDCAQDGQSVKALLEKSAYDLLIADIKMPGNTSLELVADLQLYAPGISVILVTGYPSLDTALNSITLPVLDYLVKPIDFEKLLAHVRTAVEHSRLYRIIADTQSQLEQWLEKVSAVKQVVEENPKLSSTVSVEDLIDFSFVNIQGALSNIRNLASASISHDSQKQVCDLLVCPRLHTLTVALEETIEVLEKSKSAFKSKELGALRQRLEKIMRDQGGSTRVQK